MANETRNRLRGMSDSAFEELKSKDLGKQQRLSVRKSMKLLSEAGIPVYYTAGNHDIGDDPDPKTLEQYTTGSTEDPAWGPLFQRVEVSEPGLKFLQFNSQATSCDLGLVQLVDFAVKQT